MSTTTAEKKWGDVILDKNVFRGGDLSKRAAMAVDIVKKNLYVGKEIHPSLGYITGWCLVMDYVLNPLICTIWCSRAVINFLPMPIADGGHMVFLIYEQFSGRPPSARVQNAAAIVGLVLIGTILLVVTYNDINGVFEGLRRYFHK